MVADDTVHTRGALFDHGSHIVRADFHLHTRADKEFSYEGDPRDFCKEYVRRLDEEGIAVGVVTNHNKFEYEEFKALRKAASKRGILLLPGVELSVADGSNGVHTLVVFSEEWLEKGIDRINPLLGMAFGGQPAQEFQNRNGRTKDNLLRTIDLLEDGYDDFFLVFAHVSQRNGLWKEVQGGRLQELGMHDAFRRRTLGFQKVNQANVEGRANVRRWLGDWYPAEVEGSDCKRVEEIGKGSPCYLQLGELSFAAVKYALSDHRNRVSRERRRASHSYVLSAAFEGGVLDGKTVHFSPHLNTVIGVRGSGKSSVLECTRYALDVPLGSTAYDQGYKSELVGHVLGSGGTVTLQIVDASGRKFEVRRIYNEEPRVFADGVELPNVSAPETVVYNPLYFGQKDLAANGFEQDLVEKFIWKDLKDVRARIRSQVDAVRETVTGLNEFVDTDERKRELDFKKGNAKAKIKFYERYGIEEKLKKRWTFDDDEARCERLERVTSRYLEGIEALIDEFDGKFEPEMSHESEENAEIFGRIFEVFQENSRSLDNLKRLRLGVRDTLKRLKENTRQLRIKKDSLREEFAEIERKMAEQFAESAGTRVSTEEYRRLRRTVAETTDELEELGHEVSRRASLEEDLRRELTSLHGVWQEEYEAIRLRVEEINGKHPALRIRVRHKADKAAYLERLKVACKGSNIRETTLALLVEQFEDFGHMYLGFQEARVAVGRSASKFEDYFMRHRAELLTWQVPHAFAVEYHGKDLRHHSLGQRASALIIFILSQQDNDIILIDQPEDDLDSRTIYEDVVKLVRELKPGVQFIFATHNANFPVLGDAEQVLSCFYSDDEITVGSGSINSHEIQTAVVDIMEGGAEAFSQRRKIYEMWDD